MRNFAIMLGGVCALLSSLIAVGSGLSAHATDLPSYFKEIGGTDGKPGRDRDQKYLAAQHDHVRTLRRCRAGVQEEYPCPAPAHPRIVLGGWWTIHPLSTRDGANGRAAGTDSLSIAQVRRPQHDGVRRSRRSLSEQSQRLDLAWVVSGVPRPDAIRPRGPCRDIHG